jgi:hypothetical protein
VFGVEKIYPACESAEGFCKLIGRKTLTEENVRQIKTLGYEVQVQSSHPATLYSGAHPVGTRFGGPFFRR